MVKRTTNVANVEHDASVTNVTDVKLVVPEVLAG
jgi:hypothetical protein